MWGLTIAGAFGLLVISTLNRPAFAEASVSSSYSIETTSVACLGGASASPSYSSAAILGQGVAVGSSVSASYATSGGLLNDADLDGDGIRGPLDLCPAVNAVCSDSNSDGCIDTPDPDIDGDGVTRGRCDCNDSDTSVWGIPGEIPDLTLAPEGPNPVTTLRWGFPAEPGGVLPLSDVLRSNNAGNFVDETTCLATNSVNAMITDSANPAPGAAFFYLVRAKNGCPSSGSLGTDSGLHLRVGRTCL